MRQAIVDVAGRVDADALLREDNTVVLLVRRAEGVHHEVADVVVGYELDLSRCEQLCDLSIKLSFM
jgi:hypothetical protein